jgi:hypothetical protein
VGDRLRRTSRYAPLAMSLIALAVVLEGAIEFGTQPPKDEGWQAHIWQLLMVLQLPIVLLFIATSWRSLRRILPMLALQLSLLGINLAAVYFLKL